MPGTADLDNPLYYLENFETVVSWVHTHHGDLLSAAERDCLKALTGLTRPARALLVRMVMRSGDCFRLDKLRYPELGAPEPRAAAELVRHGWLEADPLLPATELLRLFTLRELRPALAGRMATAGLKTSASKAALRTALMQQQPNPLPLHHWSAHLDAEVLRVRHGALFDRLRLMFFGNLRQSWSDFVLVELGHHRYEPVPLSAESRAFGTRAEVDCYLLLHDCRERLDAGEAPATVWQDAPERLDNPWLETRRARLLFELGKLAERGGDTALALTAFEQSGHRQARLRQLRLLERLKEYRQAWTLAHEALGLYAGEERGLERILKRLAKKLERPAQPVPVRPAIETVTLTLAPQPGHSVEGSAMNHLHSDDAPVFYVENTLFNGLFGLLCWEALFAPLPGAFFHPFHPGPVDLYREDFVARRQTLFDRCLARLSDGRYQQHLWQTWSAKQGITNRFVIWPVLSEDLLQLALDCIPASHLRLIFERKLRNLREYRSGFPDLIRFRPGQPDPERRYEMIEVKGPGDRLQDHQQRWLEFFIANGISASVCHVRWQVPDG